MITLYLIFLESPVEMSQNILLHSDDYPISYRYWLEYNIEKDAVFYFYCYLFGQDVGKQEGETFAMKGFKLWN